MKHGTQVECLIGDTKDVKYVTPSGETFKGLFKDHSGGGLIEFGNGLTAFAR